MQIKLQTINELNERLLTYKNLDKETNFSASDLAYGKHAYTSSGEYITGTHIESCVSGTFICTTCTSEQILNDVTFNPTYFVMHKSISDNDHVVNYFDKRTNASKYYGFNGCNPNPTYIEYNISDRFRYSNNTFSVHDGFSTWVNSTFYYVACR